MTPEQTLAAFWARIAPARRRVYAVVALKGAALPEGTMLTWGVLRSYAEQCRDRRGDADKWQIQEMEPPA